MGKTAEITLLFDSYGSESANLYESFVNAGIACNAVSIEDDGFLPDGVTSVFGFFQGDFTANPKLPGKPLYFNQIDIPKYWEITSTTSNGKVFDKDQERARLFYAEPKNKRLVSVIDWLDRNGKVRLCEHYNKYGALVSKTTLNKDGYKVCRTFFDAFGREVVMENFVTGDFIVNYQGVENIFHSKNDFIRFFFKCSGLENTNIIFNSLSFPFFASQSLPANGHHDSLFWNEPVGDEIPGNMRIILNGQATRANKIYVQRKAAYDRLIELGASPEIVKPLGYVYSFVRENRCNPEILICTNSDNISHLEDLVKMVPGMRFHVAALTEMSDKLTALEDYENVSLYPNVKETVQEYLFDKCDIYLDINFGNEILDAVHKAFLNNMLIISFDETIHNRNYISDTNIFPQDEYANLAEALNLVLVQNELIGMALVKQLEESLSEELNTYRAIEF